MEVSSEGTKTMKRLQLITGDFYTAKPLSSDVAKMKEWRGRLFVYGNLASWKSKKQNVVARYSTESSAMAQTTSELMWIRLCWRNWFCRFISYEEKIQQRLISTSM
ncbi:Uncharacterized protein TCM_039515 [Theobroma cacao]|uniref:Uncharacterized protein n=1 Tax=Theobroma cacao TaxID=3641 RepID=A0A061GQE1_THECC|nr:Uncharacterized protein TCM_039515 [Theobroma cacao]